MVGSGLKSLWGYSCCHQSFLLGEPTFEKSVVVSAFKSRLLTNGVSEKVAFAELPLEAETSIVRGGNKFCNVFIRFVG